MQDSTYLCVEREREGIFSEVHFCDILSGLIITVWKSGCLVKKRLTMHTRAIRL